MATEVAKREYRKSLIRKQEFTPADVKRQADQINELMQLTMVRGVHYGVIPECGEKPTLLKPGAEKINLMFQLSPELVETNETRYEGFHKEYRVVMALKHTRTGRIWGMGTGSCSTLESKYRYRNAARKCPNCQKESIIKGKAEWGGGWICWKKKGGCGSKFSENDPNITNQEAGKIENEDPADQWNTVLKMAKKRALVDAVLGIGACSDLFTQDLDDIKNNKSAQKGEPVMADFTELDEHQQDMPLEGTDPSRPIPDIGEPAPDVGVLDFFGCVALANKVENYQMQQDCFNSIIDAAGKGAITQEEKYRATKILNNIVTNKKRKHPEAFRE